MSADPTAKMITMADSEVHEKLTELGRAQARIAELEAEVARLNRLLSGWREAYEKNIAKYGVHYE